MILRIVLFALISLAPIYGSPVATLEESNLTGAPGSTVLWTVNLAPDAVYWMIVTSVQSDYLPFPAGLSADAEPVVDLLSLWFQTASVALSPGGSPLVQPLGSFAIRSDALAGAAESALIRIFYDLYDNDPFSGGGQIFPDDDPGFLELPSSVSVSEVPEPGSWLLLVSGLAALLRPFSVCRIRAPRKREARVSRRSA